MNEYLQLDLSGYDIFSFLAPSDQERLKSLLRPKTFSKNEIIFLKGDDSFGLYLITSGRVKICVVDRHGVELIFTYLSRGDILGEMAILDGKPRSATAIADESTTVFCLDRRDFLDFLKTSPEASIAIINMLCQRLRRMSTQLEEVSFLDVSGRIARNLMQITHSGSMDSTNKEKLISCDISQEELAKIVGASRVMVNKVLNSFVDQGLLSLARKKLIILNTNELSRIAAYDGDE